MDEHKKDLLIGFFIYALNILLVYYLWQNNIALTVIFIGISGFVLLKWATNKEERTVYFASFVLGPILDLILVPRGVWTWGNPSLFGIPLWLPFFYGVMIVIAIKIGKSIAELLK